MQIIGLTGAAGSGKDTAAQFALEWCKEHGLQAKRLAFADPLKVSAARALGFFGDKEECVAFCNDLKRPGVELRVDVANMPHRNDSYCVTGREFLQFYGTEAHRDVFGVDFWVEFTERQLAMRDSLGRTDVIFLTDVRFENESDMIHKRGGEVWKVMRPGLAPIEEHASEEGLSELEDSDDEIILNIGTIEYLRREVQLVCDQRLEAK
jgi:hypothetical protein